MALKPFSIPIVVVRTQANAKNDKIVLNMFHIYAHTYIQLKPGKSE